MTKSKMPVKLGQKVGMEIVWQLRQRVGYYAAINDKKRALAIQRYADDIQRQLGRL